MYVNLFWEKSPVGPRRRTITLLCNEFQSLKSTSKSGWWWIHTRKTQRQRKKDFTPIYRSTEYWCIHSFSFVLLHTVYRTYRRCWHTFIITSTHLIPFLHSRNVTECGGLISPQKYGTILVCRHDLITSSQSGSVSLLLSPSFDLRYKWDWGL